MNDYLFYSVFGYGAWEIKFKKIFHLPFVPFLGLMLIDGKEGEITLDLVNNEYKRTMFSFDYEQGLFEVDCHELWKRGVTDETVDYILQYYPDAGWERMDNTNIEQYKELMKRNQKF